jgi:ceramide glucosyltransferase
MEVAIIAGWVLVGTALASASYALAAAHVAGRFFARPAADVSSFPSVTLLKPLHGAEPDLGQNLESFCAQDYPGVVQLLFGVQRAEDAAIPVVEALRKAYPHCDMTVVMGACCEATNPKIGNLISMLPGARHDVLVLSDSDIGVPSDYVRKMAAALEEPGVGAVTCCYVGRALDNIWSQLATAGIDYHFLPNVMLGMVFGLAQPCFGSTIALQRSVLAAIGGFETYGDRLADDYEIGNAVRALGYRVAILPFVVTHTCSETSCAALLRHELRWARTIRAVEPLGYVGSVVTHALPLSLIGAALLGFSLPALAACAAALAARLHLKRKIDHSLARRGASPWLVPLRDVLSFAVFAGSFLPGRVDWRGRRYRVEGGGKLVRE